MWARLADGVLLVTRKSITEKQQLKRGLEAIERGKLLGIGERFHRYRAQ
jgi:hypothetical protein